MDKEVKEKFASYSLGENNGRLSALSFTDKRMDNSAF